MGTIAEKAETIKTLAEEALLDALKFEKGNNAAGTRLTKAMQSMKKIAQEVRSLTFEAKKSA